jgi:membrane protease subunit HflC
MVLYSGLYTVQEWEQVVIIEFGKPVDLPVTKAGLHWKTPFIQVLHRFDKRVLEFDGQATEIPTGDKKFIFVDTFARWRINDPLKFYQTVVNEPTARLRLNDIINSRTRDVISKYNLIELVRNSKRQLMQDQEVLEATQGGLQGPDEPSGEGDPAGDPSGRGFSRDALPAIERGGRMVIAEEILISAREQVGLFGIELVDVQIKEVQYVQSVRDRVFDRMKSERQQIASKYRAEGQKFSSQMEGSIERKRNEILSEAYRKAETLKGEAEAEATRIYAQAYGRDPEFYQFWKTLEIYKEHVGDNFTVVLGTDSDLFRYLKKVGLAEGAR